MEIKIKVPSSLSEITLSQYKQYIKVVETASEGDKHSAFLSLKILEIFCNVPYKVALKFQVRRSSVLLKKYPRCLTKSNR